MPGIDTVQFYSAMKKNKIINIAVKWIDLKSIILLSEMTRLKMLKQTNKISSLSYVDPNCHVYMPV